MTKPSAHIENFFRRWSSVDITPDNAILFDEHLMGVQALATKIDLRLLDGITRHTTRSEFARRYLQLTAQHEN
jgi:hypothetical protein